MFKNYKFKISHIFWGLFLIIGSFIIFLAIMCIKLLFFSTTANVYELSESYDEFQVAYYDNYNANDLPDELELVRSYCKINENETSYTFTLTFTNTGSSEQSIAVQLFWGDEFMSAYGDSVRNPFYTIYETDGVLIYPDDELSFEYTGVIYGDKEEFIENFEDIYLEVMLDTDVGRIQLPVTFG